MRGEHARHALDHHLAHVVLGLPDQRDAADRARGERRQPQSKAPHPARARPGFSGAATAEKQPRRPRPAVVGAGRRQLGLYGRKARRPSRRLRGSPYPPSPAASASAPAASVSSRRASSRRNSSRSRGAPSSSSSASGVCAGAVSRITSFKARARLASVRAERSASAWSAAPSALSTRSIASSSALDRALDANRQRLGRRRRPTACAGLRTRVCFRLLARRLRLTGRAPGRLGARPSSASPQ